MDNQMSQDTKHKKLIETHTNNIKISDMNLKDKFTYFELSRLQESKTLLYEITEKPKYFKRYGRGRIVKVRFGVNIGSEFSGDHFAIVVSKNDTAFNPVLHVIPISSKNHKSSINLGNVLIIDEEIEKLKELYELETNKLKKRKIKECLKYYSNRDNISSYALIEHMKTISKLSIMPPINEYDYIKKLRISDELMKQINEQIKEEFIL